MPFLITCIAKMLFADVRICNPTHILLQEVLQVRKIVFKQNGSKLSNFFHNSQCKYLTKLASN
jgi:hypothetical protein